MRDVVVLTVLTVKIYIFKIYKLSNNSEDFRFSTIGFAKFVHIENVYSEQMYN